MTCRMVPQKINRVGSGRAALVSLLVGATLLIGCRTSNVVYPHAQAYAGGQDKGMTALLTCKSPAQTGEGTLVRGGPFHTKEYITSDAVDEVQAWYSKTLGGWEKVDMPSPPDRKECPHGTLYAFPKGCTRRGEECTRLVYILEVGSNETWIAVFQPK